MGTYSTLDHIFNLKCIPDIYLKKENRLYIAFIDYRKVLDSVLHVGQWKNLLQHNINGKIFDVIRNLLIYTRVKSCVNLGRSGQVLSFFGCNVGIRQG